MLDLKSSPVCRYSNESEKPLSLAAMLFAILVIMFVTSSLQSTLLAASFVIAKAGPLLQASKSENFPEEILALLEEFAVTDAALAIQLFATVTTIVLTLVLCVFLLKRRPASLGLVRRGAAWQYVLGLVLGGALFAASIAIASVNGSVTLLGLASPVRVGMLILLFFGYVVQGASEEILFRGFFMCDMARRGSPILAVTLSSLAFALAHLSNVGIGVVAILNLFLFGVLASLLTLRTGSLVGALSLHTAWNFTQGHVFGCRVSGLITESTVLRSEALLSHKLTNGGEFGPEGGVAVTVVFLVFIVLLLVLPSKKNNTEAE